ncbi:co-chaperone HscB [Pseudoalteromonas denitrificans]|uniref:Co-chaperone protein HscB homolog n=1 Tax=Pseudoalteromonas denitrificans DSM 6059 TaxID=1123010 RepID=A0A1I1E3H5_9GAMM|nr:co-chaperone HscB [Pseudoalteromonas denitrificans]SFB79403.1 Co-chaperone protein HscB [Pseudoalteromonas denitrificans DSM 6059]
MKYFALFSLPVDFNIDLELLNQAYLQLQKAVHPDKYAHKSSAEQLLAVQKSAQINDALHILKHPLKRAEYMLSERGIDIRAEQQTLQDPMFLMQQMELREELEDIKEANDPDAAISAFDKQIKKIDLDYHTQLKTLIAQTDIEQLHRTADVVRKLKFIYKLREELERVEDSLFDD